MKIMHFRPSLVKKELKEEKMKEYTVNAQGRTETWYRSLPHYVMAHLVFHFNKNPKKE